MSVTALEGTPMSNPTPGPWNLVKRSVTGNGFYGIQSYPAGPDGKPICTFDDYPSDADLRLMVAAPALLEALKAFLSHMGAELICPASADNVGETVAKAMVAIFAAEPIPPYLLTITRKDGSQYTDTAKTANDANRMENEYWDRADTYEVRVQEPQAS